MKVWRSISKNEVWEKCDIDASAIFTTEEVSLAIRTNDNTIDPSPINATLLANMLKSRPEAYKSILNDVLSSPDQELSEEKFVAQVLSTGKFLSDRKVPRKLAYELLKRSRPSIESPLWKAMFEKSK